MCTNLESGIISKSLYQICFTLSSYIIPLLIISGLYMRLIMRLWQSSNAGVRMSAESRSGRKRVTRLVVVVVVAFASLWFPIQVSCFAIFRYLSLSLSHNIHIIHFLFRHSTSIKTNKITSILFFTFTIDNFITEESWMGNNDTIHGNAADNLTNFSIHQFLYKPTTLCIFIR